MTYDSTESALGTPYSRLLRGVWLSVETRERVVVSKRVRSRVGEKSWIESSVERLPLTATDRSHPEHGWFHEGIVGPKCGEFYVEPV